jgi:hypothetical protein
MRKSESSQKTSPCFSTIMPVPNWEASWNVSFLTATWINSYLVRPKTVGAVGATAVRILGEDVTGVQGFLNPIQKQNSPSFHLCLAANVSQTGPSSRGVDISSGAVD